MASLILLVATIILRVSKELRNEPLQYPYISHDDTVVWAAAKETKLSQHGYIVQITGFLRYEPYTF